MRSARTATAGMMVAATLACLAPSAAQANIVTLNPGVKLAYTFGRGWTYGLELSVAWMTPDLDWVIGSGAVLDLTWSKNLFELRAGYEMYGLGYGLEIGPALVMDAHGTYAAVDVTSFVAGVFVDPYLTLSFGFGGPSRQELGTYLKLPLCLHDDKGCYSGGSGGGGWD